MKSAILISLATWHLAIPCPAQDSKAAAAKTELGKPFVIDGIEIVFSDPRIGGETEDPPAKDALPVAQFYKLSFKLRNVTADKIVTVFDPWEKTTLKDEHGNVYCRERVGGIHRQTKLRPGAESSGVAYFEVPLASAKELRLTTDPGVYRGGEDGLIHDLSKHSATLAVPNPAAAP